MEGIVLLCQTRRNFQFGSFWQFIHAEMMIISFRTRAINKHLETNKEKHDFMTRVTLKQKIFTFPVKFLLVAVILIKHRSESRS